MCLRVPAYRLFCRNFRFDSWALRVYHLRPWTSQAVSLRFANSDRKRLDHLISGWFGLREHKADRASVRLVRDLATPARFGRLRRDARLPGPQLDIDLRDLQWNVVAYATPFHVLIDKLLIPVRFLRWTQGGTFLKTQPISDAYNLTTVFSLLVESLPFNFEPQYRF